MTTNLYLAKAQAHQAQLEIVDDLIDMLPSLSPMEGLQLLAERRNLILRAWTKDMEAHEAARDDWYWLRRRTL